jgi:hypothetical protein
MLVCDVQLLTRADLERRGWTDALVRDFLDSDKSEFPAYSVREAETTWKFKTSKATASKRSATGKKVAAERASELCNRVSTFPLKVPSRTSVATDIVPTQLPGFELAVAAEVEEVEAMAKSMLMKCESEVDIAGQPGVHRARHTYLGRCFDAIEQSYPALSSAVILARHRHEHLQKLVRRGTTKQRDVQSHHLYFAVLPPGGSMLDGNCIAC